MSKRVQIEQDDLLAQLQHGNEMAFRVLFERFYTRLCLFADRFVNNKEASKDIVNDVFIKFWNTQKQFRHIDHVLAYLYVMTKNTALNHQQGTIRSMRRDFAYQATRGDEDTHYLAEITRTEVFNELHVAISKLPARARRIVRETYLEGKSNQEVADNMGISLQTLRNQKSRALAILRGQLNKESFELLIAGVFMIAHF